MMASILNQAQTRWYDSFVKLYFTVRSYATSFAAQSYYGSAITAKSLTTSFSLKNYYGKIRTLKQNIREFILRINK